jgi:hypothetical protein
MDHPYSRPCAHGGQGHAEPLSAVEVGTLWLSFSHCTATHATFDVKLWTENLTGTRGRYVPYNTVKSKIDAWEPKVTPRA